MTTPSINGLNGLKADSGAPRASLARSSPASASDPFSKTLAGAHTAAKERVPTHAADQPTGHTDADRSLDRANQRSDHGKGPNRDNDASRNDTSKEKTTSPAVASKAHDASSKTKGKTNNSHDDPSEQLDPSDDAPKRDKKSAKAIATPLAALIQNLTNEGGRGAVKETANAIETAVATTTKPGSNLPGNGKALPAAIAVKSVADRIQLARAVHGNGVTTSQSAASGGKPQAALQITAPLLAALTHQHKDANQHQSTLMSRFAGGGKGTASPDGRALLAALAGKQPRSGPTQPGAQLADLLTGSETKLVQTVGQTAAPAGADKAAAAMSLLHNLSAAQAPSQPRVVTLNQPVGSTAWKNAFQQQITWLANTNASAAKLQLNPSHLGPIEVRIQVLHQQGQPGAQEAILTTASKGNHQPQTQPQTQIWLYADHSATRAAMQSSLPQLQNMFDQQGIGLAGAYVLANGFDGHHGEQPSREDSAPAPIARVSDGADSVTDSDPTVVAAGGTATLGLFDAYA